MTQTIEIKVPDIGDFKDIPVIEVMVKAGDKVEVEQSLISLETDKATMDVPAPVAGVVKELKVKVGDKVTHGSVILLLESSAAATAKPTPSPLTGEGGGEGEKLKSNPSNQPNPSDETTSHSTKPASGQVAGYPQPSDKTTSHSTRPQQDSGQVAGYPSRGEGVDATFTKGDLHAEVVVLGAGPGGYTAAFRAADLGKQVILVERHTNLGGVCLNVGCIPSKALLHVAKVIAEAEDVAQHGVTFSKPKIDSAQILAWKNGIITKLTGGLKQLAKQRKVQVVQGTAKFTSPHHLEVDTKDGKKTISFDNAIIAAGSSVARIPGFPYDDPRIIDSTGALQLQDVPKRMLIIGGGIIGLEMATVYDELCSNITVVELADGLMP